jgi:hypothetical protein
MIYCTQEIIQTIVRAHDQQRRQAVIDGLRGEIERGRRSGKPKPAAEVLDRLERKYTKMAKERAK